MIGKVIVSAEYGSRAIGVATEDSDHDIMQVFIERPENITGIEPIDTMQDGTAAKGERSTREDTDRVSYPLRKWATLAAAGNPTVISLLYVPEAISMNVAWVHVLTVREAFISKEAGRKFRGYSWGQREALMGYRNKKTNRPELIHKHGYDTKFAYHMIRTAMQGVELMTQGRLTLPVESSNLAILKSIRAGEVDKETCLDMVADLDADLDRVIKGADLPDGPDRARINSTLHGIYLDDWRTDRHR